MSKSKRKLHSDFIRLAYDLHERQLELRKQLSEAEKKGVLHLINIPKKELQKVA